jgi:hypothetical protein
LESELKTGLATGYILLERGIFKDAKELTNFDNTSDAKELTNFDNNEPIFYSEIEKQYGLDARIYDDCIRRFYIFFVENKGKSFTFNQLWDLSRYGSDNLFQIREKDDAIGFLSVLETKDIIHKKGKYYSLKELTKIDNNEPKELTKIDNLLQIALSEVLQTLTLTTSEMAQQSEISKNEVSNYKSAKRAVSLEKALLIASKLGIGDVFVTQLSQAMRNHLLNL